MMHDELLKTLRENLSAAKIKLAKQPYLLSLIVKAYRPLISIVESHRPHEVMGLLHCKECREGYNESVLYPCTTIQAIEKELQ